MSQGSSLGTAERHLGLKGVEGVPQLLVSSVWGQKNILVLDKTVKSTCKYEHRFHHCNGIWMFLQMFYFNVSIALPSLKSFGNPLGNPFGKCICPLATPDTFAVILQ